MKKTNSFLERYDPNKDWFMHDMTTIDEFVNDFIGSLEYDMHMLSTDEIITLKEVAAGTGDFKYNTYQLHQIILGIKHHVDVSFYVNPTFRWEEMQMIREALESDLDVSALAYSNFGIRKMKTRTCILRRISMVRNHIYMNRVKL